MYLKNIQHKKRFLRYIKFDTCSDKKSETISN